MCTIRKEQSVKHSVNHFNNIYNCMSFTDQFLLLYIHFAIAACLYLIIPSFMDTCLKLMIV